MENSWIFYSLAGLVAFGLGDFIKKIVLKKGGNKEIFLFLFYALYAAMLGLNVLIKQNFTVDVELFKSAFTMGVIDSIIPLGMFTTLKYLDISFSLVTIRVISSIVILWIGMGLLGDDLSIYNIAGFIIGIFAIVMLSGFKIDQKMKMHKKGIIALIITIIAIISSHSYLKYIVVDVHVDSFMF